MSAFEELLKAQEQLTQAQKAVTDQFDACFLLIGYKRELAVADYIKVRMLTQQCVNVGDLYQTQSKVYRRIK